MESNKLHFDNLAEAIAESLNPKNPITYYVEDCYEYWIINGKILTIVQGNGDSEPFKKKIC